MKIAAVPIRSFGELEVGFLAFLEARCSVIGVRFRVTVRRGSTREPFSATSEHYLWPRLRVKVLDGVFGGKAESRDQS